MICAYEIQFQWYVMSASVREKKTNNKIKIKYVHHPTQTSDAVEIDRILFASAVAKNTLNKRKHK